MATRKLQFTYVVYIVFSLDNTAPEEWSSTGSDFAPDVLAKDIKKLETCLVFTTGSAFSIYWVETRDASKHPIMHKIALF